MANVLATCTIVAKEALAVLENMCTFSGAVNRDYEVEFTSNQDRGYSPGQTIQIKRPPKYTYRAGPVANPQATVEGTLPLTLSQGGSDIFFSSAERTLSLQQFQEKVYAAMVPVINEIDRQGLNLARTATFNAVGTVGTPPATQLAAVDLIAAGNQRLDELGAPRDRLRTLVNGPRMNRFLVSAMSGMFNSQTQLDKQYKSGLMVDAFGANIEMDQNVATHTNGTQNVAGTNIAGANQTGAAITVVALGGTLTAGTIIRLPGVNAVNPVSRVDTGSPAEFVVTADALAGATTINISPAIVTTGAFQNVTASPTNGAAFTVPFGTAAPAANSSYQCNVLFHKNAFTLACVPLWMPPEKGVIDSHRESHNGFSVRVVQFYDGINDNALMRIDVLFGWAATYPELSCRLLG